MREDTGRNLRAISAVLSCGQCHPLIVKAGIPARAGWVLRQRLSVTLIQTPTVDPEDGAVTGA